MLQLATSITCQLLVSSVKLEGMIFIEGKCQKSAKFSPLPHWLSEMKGEQEVLHWVHVYASKVDVLFA